MVSCRCLGDTKSSQSQSDQSGEEEPSFDLRLSATILAGICCTYGNHCNMQHAALNWQTHESSGRPTPHLTSITEFTSFPFCAECRGIWKFLRKTKIHKTKKKPKWNSLIIALIVNRVSLTPRSFRRWSCWEFNLGKLQINQGNVRNLPWLVAVACCLSQWHVFRFGRERKLMQFCVNYSLKMK